MRPIKLTMSAFGPYSGRETIDFEKLGKSGIYLITGVTGAGKTTIFDAISFALFGESSGNDRKESMLRSKYAEPSESTFVELVFEYDKKFFMVKRNPSYERPKSKGEGVTTQPAYAELTTCDGKVITKINEVNKAIQEIIGVNREQFAKIAMIAQGDFRKLLQASTEERVKILRHIFKTHNYEALQDKLFSESKEASKKIESLEQSFNQYVQGISSPKDCIFCDNLINLQAKRLDYRDFIEVLELIDKLIAFDQEKNALIDNELKTVEKEVSETDKKLNELDEQKKKTVELNQKKAEFKNTESRLTLLKAEYEKSKAEKNKIEDCDRKSAVIKVGLGDYDKLFELKKRKAELESKIRILAERTVSQKAECDETSRQVSRLKNQKSQLENAGESKATLRSEKAETENKIKIIEGISCDVESLKNEVRKAEKAKNEYLAKSQLLSLCNDEYNSLDKAYRDDIAGVLAENLTEDTPCPVCGACHHPNLAKKSDKAPTLAEVESAKTRLEEARSQADRYSVESNRINGVVNEKRSALKAKVEEVFAGLTFNTVNEIILQCEKRLAELGLALEDIKAKIGLENERMAQKAQVEKDLPLYESKLESLKNQLGENEKSEVALRSDLKNVTGEITSLSANLSFESREKASAEITRLESLKKSLQEDFNNKEEALKNAQDELSKLKGAVLQLENQLKQSVEYDRAELTSKRDELESLKAELTDKKQVGFARLNANKNLRENLQPLYAELETVAKKHGWLDTLSRTMNAGFSGKEKIKLETYVQMHLFDRIIERANVRLMQMTSGQYELKRKKAGLKGSDGLDLNVVDHYNGSERAVGSLSGGESFKASLCLALGLSDEIQARAGGVKLDTMFVDEGFGSLDDVSCELALSALVDLSQSNRLVGIISHVPQLKERIDKQIVITKDNFGVSHARIQS